MGERGTHRSRWRTDGSHYHSILGDEEREAGSEGEITMKEKEGESEYVVRVKKKKKLIQMGRGEGAERA